VGAGNGRARERTFADCSRHESARAQRMVDFFEDHVTDPLMQGGMAHLILAVYITIRTVATSSGMSKLSASPSATDVNASPVEQGLAVSKHHIDRSVRSGIVQPATVGILLSLN
jgi:hypothetical protein